MPHQSNPFSTGNGGGRFENQVQAYFVVLFLVGKSYPVFSGISESKTIKLQARPKYSTDDALITVVDNTKQDAKLLVQIKHTLTFTQSDKEYVKTLKAAWMDFFSNNNFNKERDRIVIATGVLSQTVIDHVRPIFDFARSSNDYNEFLEKLGSSQDKKDKFDAIKNIIKAFSKKTDDEKIWEFCKLLHLFSFDLDYQEQSKDKSTILSLIESAACEDSTAFSSPVQIWDKVLQFVASFNQTSGTVSFNTIPVDILLSFRKSRKTLEAEYLVKISDWELIIHRSSPKAWSSASRKKSTYLNLTDCDDLYLEFETNFKNEKNLISFDWKNIFEKYFLYKKIYTLQINIFYKNRPVKNVSLLTDGNHYLSVLPRTTERLIVDELDCKIAEIVAPFLYLHFFSVSDFRVIKHSRINVSKVKQAIDRRSLDEIKTIIQLAKLYNETSWLNHIYEQDPGLFHFGTNTDHLHYVVETHQLGNVLSLCMNTRFYPAANVLLDEYPKELDLNQYDEVGNTPLLTAINWPQYDAATKCPQLDIAIKLVKGGADLNLPTRADRPKHTGVSPLQSAIVNAVSSKSFEYYQLVELMLDHGADPNFKDNYANAYAAMLPLETVCRFSINDIDVASKLARLLITKGADLGLLDPETKHKIKKLIDNNPEKTSVNNADYPAAENQDNISSVSLGGSAEQAESTNQASSRHKRKLETLDDDLSEEKPSDEMAPRTKMQKQSETNAGLGNDASNKPEEMDVDLTSFHSTSNNDADDIPKFFSQYAAVDTHWYDDREVNALLTHYFKNNAEVDLFTAMLGTDWMAGNTLADQLKQFREERQKDLDVDQAVKGTIIIPLNLGTYHGLGTHWVLLFIKFPGDVRQKPQIIYFDPFGNPMPSDVSNALAVAELYINEVQSVSSSVQLQSDGYNCGPWVVAVADYLVTQEQGAQSSGAPFDINTALQQLKELQINDIRNMQLKLIAELNATQADKSASPPKTSQSSAGFFSPNTASTNSQRAEATPPAVRPAI